MVPQRNEQERIAREFKKESARQRAITRGATEIITGTTIGLGVYILNILNPEFFPNFLPPFLQDTFSGSLPFYAIEGFCGVAIAYGIASIVFNQPTKELPPRKRPKRRQPSKSES